MRLIILLFIAIPLVLTANDNTKHVYIVSFQAEPMTKIMAVSANETNQQSHLQKINNQQKYAINRLAQKYNTVYSPLFKYNQAINGMSLELYEHEAQYLSNLDNVLRVTKQEILHTTSDASASMVNAYGVWSGAGISPLAANKGEDVLVGIFDTGINFGHESFSDNPEDSYDFASHNPFGQDTYIGWCNPVNPNYDVSYVCNNKIIGAWDFVDAISDEDDGPIDGNYHGSHIAGIISGNNITAPPGGFVTSVTDEILNAPFISGIAPHSHVIIYDVCADSIGCPSSAVLAAIDQAILDGVDIINISLSGGLNPWNENSVSMALLNAHNAGIISSASAGNATSQQPISVGNVNHLAPWIMTVANSFHGRTQSNDVSVTSLMPVPEFLVDMYSVISDSMVAFVNDIESHIIYSKDIDSNNETGCLAWDPLDFNGAVALIKSSECSYELKIQNAEDAGAIAVIVFNADSDIPVLMSDINSPSIPATMIGLTDANNLINYIQTQFPDNTMVEIISETKHKLVNALGMVLYHSSLRGPNNDFNITKPDIAAPGTAIFSAIADLGFPAPQYFVITGTSQSTAVVSGALALLKSLRPNWSPSELKSALMISANDGLLFEDGGMTTTDDIGAGMLDVTQAANTVLVMDEIFINYEAANPEIGGNPKDLNIASLRDNHCINGCSWSRTFVNKDTISHSWTISFVQDEASIVSASQNTITLAAEESITLTFDFIPISGDVDQLRYAKIILTDDDQIMPTSQLTIAVYLDDLIFNNGFE